MGKQGRSRPARSLRKFFFTVSTAVTAAVLLAAPTASAALDTGTEGNLCSGDACGRSIIELGEGLMVYALITAAAGIMVSAMLWAVGSKGQNPGTELAGKRGMIVCCSAAFLIGALPQWLGFLETTAGQVDADVKRTTPGAGG